MKNGFSFILCHVMNVYEQQSSYNPNMPVRQLMYAAKLYDKYIRQKKLNFSEARAVPISKLELCDNRIVYDIGAGTGSVAVEMALAMGHGHVYAIEQREEGCRLIG